MQMAQSLQSGSPTLRAFIMPKVWRWSALPRNRERQRANRRLKEMMVGPKNAEGYIDMKACTAINKTIKEDVKRNAKKS